MPPIGPRPGRFADAAARAHWEAPWQGRRGRRWRPVAATAAGESGGILVSIDIVIDHILISSQKWK